MDNSLKVQTYIFLTSIYGGLLIGFVYDLYKIFRYFLKPKKIATFIEDALFWLIVTIVVFFILIKSTWGELRGYIFVGLFIGVLLYLRFVSVVMYPILIKMFRFIISIIKIPFHKIKQIVNPFTRMFKKVNRIIKELAKETRKYISIFSKKK